MKVIKLRLHGSGLCVYDAKDCPALIEEIKEMQYCEVGERWTITIGEMSEKEYNKLPEFIGW